METDPEEPFSDAENVQKIRRGFLLRIVAELVFYARSPVPAYANAA